MITPAEVQTARRLFEEGWSAGNPDAPKQFLAEGVVMRDTFAHPDPIRGWPAIREFWGKWAPSLRVKVEDTFVSDHGVSLTWIAYWQRQGGLSASGGGAWNVGEGISRLEFRDGQVCLQVNYWHGRQGSIPDWKSHWEERSRLSRQRRGAVTGAVSR